MMRVGGKRWEGVLRRRFEMIRGCHRRRMGGRHPFGPRVGAGVLRRKMVVWLLNRKGWGRSMKGVVLRRAL